MKEEILKWVCGWGKDKRTYPAPWSAMPTFPVDKTVTLTFGPSDYSSSHSFKDSVELGDNIIKAVNAFLTGEAFVSMTVHDDIIVEFRPDVYTAELLHFHAASGNVSASVCNVRGATMEPMNIYRHSGVGMALLCLMEMYVATTLRTRKPMKAEPILAFESLAEVAPIPLMDCSPALVVDHISALAKLALSLKYWLSNGHFKGKTEPGFKHLADFQPPRIAVDGVGNIAPCLTREALDMYGRQKDFAVACSSISALRILASKDLKANACFFVPYPPIDTSGAPCADIQDEAPMSAMEMVCKECALPIHALSAVEKTMVAEVQDSYVFDSKIISIAQTIKADWHFPLVDLAPNIILEGASGSGKTSAVKFLSKVWGIPYTKLTMSPTFESADLIGSFYPVIPDVSEWDISEQDKKALLSVQEALESVSAGSDNGTGPDIVTALRHGMANENVRETIRIAYELPTVEEVVIAPDDAWKRLGHDGDPPDVDAIRLEADRQFERVMYRLLVILMEKAQNGGVSYRFVLSELMRAFKHGWLVEIQEAASVLRPGVLTELNSLLEPNGRIELKNGQYIQRHPDTIVVITTNRDYEGNMDLNEALRDRCVLGEKMDLPPVEVMAERAMAQTGFISRKDAITAATALVAVGETAQARHIKGAFGMRSLIAWMLDLKRGDYSTDAFMRRVVYKMTTRDADVEFLKDAYEANCGFASRTFQASRATT